MVQNDHEAKKICCVGGGYVGGCSAVVLAFQLPTVDVIVVDKNKSRVASWNSDTLPFSEPGLLNLVLASRDGKAEADTTHVTRRPNLSFSTNVDDAIRGADLIFVAVDTPHGMVDAEGDLGAAPNLISFQAAIRTIGTVAEKDFVLVNRSTVPCGTAEETNRMLSTLVRPDIKFEVLSNPEFLAEGTAVRDLFFPDRVLIGSLETDSGHQAAAILANLYTKWVSPHRILMMDSRSSELSKLAANALLAQRISSINALSAICDEVGADIIKLSHACSLDHRIGQHMLKATLGFGGSCFKKDLLHLAHTASHLGLTDVATYWSHILSINEYQTKRFISLITSQIPNATEPKTVGTLGFAFKPGSDDTRESPAIAVVRALILKRYHVRIFDPLVSHKKILNDIQASLAGQLPESIVEEQVTICSNVYEASEGAHALAILNEWEALRVEATTSHGDGDTLRCSNVNGQVDGASSGSERRDPDVDWKQIAIRMHTPKYIFDGHNVVDPRAASHGFIIQGVGRRGSLGGDIVRLGETAGVPGLGRSLSDAPANS